MGYGSYFFVAKKSYLPCVCYSHTSLCIYGRPYINGLTPTGTAWPGSLFTLCCKIPDPHTGREMLSIFILSGQYTHIPVMIVYETIKCLNAAHPVCSCHVTAAVHQQECGIQVPLDFVASYLYRPVSSSKAAETLLLAFE